MNIRSGIKFWALLIVVTICALILWRMIQNMLAVAAVQEALERNWEIGFRPPIEQSRPPLLPAFIDEAVEDYLAKRYRNVAGYNENEVPPHGRNLDTVYQERFRAMFRPTIRDIHIFSPFAFRGDLGAALQRFPRLQSVIVSDANYAKEAEWKLLCTRLRGVPELEELELSGSSLTDDAIAPLAGHPRLRSLVVYERSSTDCLKTFGSLSCLTHLTVSAPDEDAKRFCAGLRMLTRLEELALEGNLTDEAVAQLAGHPGLRSISLRSRDLTAECLKTLSSLPRLTDFRLSQGGFLPEWLTPEVKAAFLAAHPNVTIIGKEWVDPDK